MSSLLTLNYFTPFASFPVVDFEQENISWENYLTLYSFDICFTGGNNAGNSVILLISHTQWDITLGSLQYSNDSFKEHWKVCINATIVKSIHQVDNARTFILAKVCTPLSLVVKIFIIYGSAISKKSSSRWLRTRLFQLECFRTKYFAWIHEFSTTCMLLANWKLIRFLLFQQLRANHFPKILILWFA